MTIQEIYSQYQIMPNLQLHMYRVTGVAQQICEALTEAINVKEILSACLLHDMGNILKFDLEKFPEFLKPNNLEFWQNVQKGYRQKYGEDEHQASIKIAGELPVSLRVRELIDAVSFSQIQEVVESSDLAKKICEYADDRVTPFGVANLAKRLQDLEDRYSQKYPSLQDQQKRKRFATWAFKLEQQIFQRASIQPTDITDQSVNARLENLQKFEIIP